MSFRNDKRQIFSFDPDCYEMSKEDVNALATLFSDWKKLSSMDNKELAWLVVKLFSDTDEVLGRKGLVIDEVVNRLYPEWDGDDVLFTDTGWKTPEGDINYITAPAGAQTERDV